MSRPMRTFSTAPSMSCSRQPVGREACNAGLPPPTVPPSLSALVPTAEGDGFSRHRDRSSVCAHCSSLRRGPSCSGLPDRQPSSTTSQAACQIVNSEGFAASAPYRRCRASAPRSKLANTVPSGRRPCAADGPVGEIAACAQRDQTPVDRRRVGDRFDSGSKFAGVMVVPTPPHPSELTNTGTGTAMTVARKSSAWNAAAWTASSGKSARSSTLLSAMIFTAGAPVQRRRPRSSP